MELVDFKLKENIEDVETKIVKKIEAVAKVKKKLERAGIDKVEQKIRVEENVENEIDEGREKENTKKELENIRLNVQENFIDGEKAKVAKN